MGGFYFCISPMLQEDSSIWSLPQNQIACIAMKKTGQSSHHKDNFRYYSFQALSSYDYQARRRLEMKRRFGILQSRRSNLERELEAVNTSLISLDRQMQSYAAYEQLSMKTHIKTFI